jgi:hypothetical protein
MTDRENLIEILRYGMDKYFLLKFEAEIFAELLIANGVTFATDTNDGCKWISVEDRLPEKAMRCFVYQKRNNEWGGYVSLATFDPCYKGGRGNHMNGKQVWYEYDSEYGDYELPDVTHWMLTPKPPKED